MPTPKSKKPKASLGAIATTVGDYVPAPKDAHKCRYCDGHAVYHEHSDHIYRGKDYGPVYSCSHFPKCDAYVGVHKGSNEPLGYMARKPLRSLRKSAHEFVDALTEINIHVGVKNPKSAVYLALAGYLRKPVNTVHMGWMDENEIQTALFHLSKMTEGCRELLMTLRTEKNRYSAKKTTTTTKKDGELF